MFEERAINLAVFALRFQRRAPAGGKISFHGAFFRPCLAALMAKCGREIILCGDWNIAHQGNRSEELDSSNQKNCWFSTGGAGLADARCFEELGLDGCISAVCTRIQRA